jgi:hypothetical protein
MRRNTFRSPETSMKRFEADQVRDQVERTTGAVLPEASAARTARMLASVSATLDHYAGGSLFDTEPALLATTLSALRSGGSGR